MGEIAWSPDVPLILSDLEADFIIGLRRTPKHRVVRRREEAQRQREDAALWRAIRPNASPLIVREWRELREGAW